MVSTIPINLVLPASNVRQYGLLYIGSLPMGWKAVFDLSFQFTIFRIRRPEVLQSDISGVFGRGGKDIENILNISKLTGIAYYSTHHKREVALPCYNISHYCFLWFFLPSLFDFCIFLCILVSSWFYIPN